MDMVDLEEYQGFEDWRKSRVLKVQRISKVSDIRSNYSFKSMKSIWSITSIKELTKAWPGYQYVKQSSPQPPDLILVDNTGRCNFSKQRKSGDLEKEKSDIVSV